MGSLEGPENRGLWLSNGRGCQRHKDCFDRKPRFGTDSAGSIGTGKVVVDDPMGKSKTGGGIGDQH